MCIRDRLGRYAQWLGVAPGWVITDASGVTRGRCLQAGATVETAPRYCGVLQGNWGFSTVFKKPVLASVSEKLGSTGWLMLWVMLVMVPVSLIMGVLAGMREGSRTDRVLSAAAIVTTATPEYVSGVILVAIFASATVSYTHLFRRSLANAPYGHSPSGRRWPLAC